MRSAFVCLCLRLRLTSSFCRRRRKIKAQRKRRNDIVTPTTKLTLTRSQRNANKNLLMMNEKSNFQRKNITVSMMRNITTHFKYIFTMIVLLVFIIIADLISGDVDIKQFCKCAVVNGQESDQCTCDTKGPPAVDSNVQLNLLFCATIAFMIAVQKDFDLKEKKRKDDWEIEKEDWRREFQVRSYVR